MQPINSIQRWVDAAGQLNSMLCSSKNDGALFGVPSILIGERFTMHYNESSLDDFSKPNIS